MTSSKTTPIAETAKDLRDQAADYVETLKPHVIAALTSALENVEEFVESTARPALADAGVKAREAALEAGEQAKSKGLPLMATGASYVADKADEAKKFATDKADEFTGRKKARRRRRLLTFLGLAAAAGVAAVIAKKATGGGQDTWQSAVGPTPSPVMNDGPVSDDAVAEPEFTDDTKPAGDPLT